MTRVWLSLPISLAVDYFSMQFIMTHKIHVPDLPTLEQFER
jgi:hypothetical protein